jgi:putative toxin-antitoxin system antitoxin component (TIGR02293 family)
MEYRDPPEPFVAGLRQEMGFSESVVRESSAYQGSGPAAVIARIRKGMPIEEFHGLADWLAMVEDDLAPLIGISRATLHRRKKSGHLEAPESERIVRIARLMARATAVLETTAAARSWLKRPAVALAGESPLAFSDTGIGAHEVECLLGRIEHGVFS